MLFDYGNGKVNIEVSFYTLLVYEQEFGSDMIKDLFGRVVINEDDSGEIVLDYTQNNWTSAAKALWACAKTANEGIMPFREWARTMTNGINMIELYNNLHRVIEQELFRFGVPSVSEQNGE